MPPEYHEQASPAHVAQQDLGSFERPAFYETP